MNDQSTAYRVVQECCLKNNKKVYNESNKIKSHQRLDTLIVKKVSGNAKKRIGKFPENSDQGPADHEQMKAYRS